MLYEVKNNGQGWTVYDGPNVLGWVRLGGADESGTRDFSGGRYLWIIVREGGADLRTFDNWEDAAAAIVDAAHPEREADAVREALHDDPFVSNEDYGRLVAEADASDQAREAEAERESREPAAAIGGVVVEPPARGEQRSSLLAHALAGLCEDPDCELHFIEVAVAEGVVDDTNIAFWLAGAARGIALAQDGVEWPAIVNVTRGDI